MPLTQAEWESLPVSFRAWLDRNFPLTSPSEYFNTVPVLPPSAWEKQPTNSVRLHCYDSDGISKPGLHPSLWPNAEGGLR